MKATKLETTKAFSDIVSARLARSGKTYRQAVEGSDVNHTILHGVVSERFVPRLDTVLRVCDILGLEVIVRKRRVADD